MNYILYLLFVTVLPVLIGCLTVSDGDGKPYTVISRWCAGFVSMLALTYIPAAACIFFHRSLTDLIVVLTLVYAAAGAAGAVKLVKNRENPVKSFFTMIRTGNLFELLAFVLPAIHAAVTFFMMHVDDDDVAYVGAVTTSVDTNTLMKYDAVNGRLITDFAVNEMDRLTASPQFAFYAYVSKVFSIRPAVLCHTFFPPVLTMLFFAAFLLVGRELYPEDRKKSGLFSVFAFLISISSYFSVYTAGTFILVRSWQGKAQIVGLILPLIFVLAMRVIRRGASLPVDTLYGFVLLGAASLLTSMGAVLACLELGVLFVVASFMRKDRMILVRMLPAYILPAVMLIIYFVVL